MIGTPIVSRITQLQHALKHVVAASPPAQLDLHTAWAHPERLPRFVRESPLIQRCLDLLGPLAWDRLPERNLQRNWGQPTIPYAAFIAACLLKLNEDKKSMGDLRLLLSEHPELIWLLGFPLSISNPGSLGFAVQASLPTTRHLTRLLREMPNEVLQFLLADSVHLVRAALAAEGVKTGDCISLDTKHILAWVKENNPKAYVEDRFDKTKQPAGDPDCKLGCKRRHNRRKAGDEPPVSTPAQNPVPAKDRPVGEFYWGYGSGVVVAKAPEWGEIVLAELT